jgi:hypothetical protein
MNFINSIPIHYRVGFYIFSPFGRIQSPTPFFILYIYIKKIMAKNKRLPRNKQRSKKSFKKTLKRMNENKEVLEKVINSQL